MFDDLVCIRKLIRDESEAVANYTEAISKATNPSIKKVLSDIRDEEIVHIGELKQLLVQVLGICDGAKEAEGRREAQETLNQEQNHASMQYNRALDAMNKIPSVNIMPLQ